MAKGSYDQIRKNLEQITTSFKGRVADAIGIMVNCVAYVTF